MKKLIVPTIAILLFAGVAALPGYAQDGNGYDRIVSHLKTRYQAKKVNIPFMWLARFAVSVVRPAGVKSFSVTLFKDLKLSIDEVDTDMQAAMRSSFGPEWTPMLRIRSRKGQQAYMYVREDGDRMRMALVTIEKDQASIIRATFSPTRLTDFIDDPSILGIHLDDGKQKQPENPGPSKSAPPA